MFDWLDNAFSVAQEWLFQAAVQPLVFALGEGALLEEAHEATAWLLAGVLQLVVIVALIAPLQRFRPVEPITDRATIRTDIFYTLLHRLGVFRLALFFAVDPLFDALFGSLRSAGWGTFHLDQLWPGVTDIAVVSFILYLVIFDAVDYWIHRGQHHFSWWWSLHSLHHAQRQMTVFSDNRNHLLDDALRDSLIVLVAQLIGVAPGQFIAIVAFTQLSESLQHANVRLWFGTVGERLWVSPRFHRLHHSVGLGHESPIRPKPVKRRDAGPPQGAAAPSGGSDVQAVTSVGVGRDAGPPQGAAAPSGGSDVHAVTSVGVRLGGKNFGVLLPWWDMLFGTANFELRYDPTGVRDQVEQGRNYGQGFWAQQWLGLLRLVGQR